LAFLGEIPSSNSFEIRKPIGKINASGTWNEDYNMDDTALIYKSVEGLFIITGCSHSGICNIVEYAPGLNGGEFCKIGLKFLF